MVIKNDGLLCDNSSWRVGRVPCELLNVLTGEQDDCPIVDGVLLL